MHDNNVEAPKHAANEELTITQRLLRSILNVEKADLLIAGLHLLVTSLAVFGLVQGGGGH